VELGFLDLGEYVYLAQVLVLSATCKVQSVHNVYQHLILWFLRLIFAPLIVQVINIIEFLAIIYVQIAHLLVLLV